MPFPITDGSVAVKPSTDVTAKALDNDQVDDGTGIPKFRQRVRIVGPDSAAISRVTNDGANHQLAAANARRRGLVVYNESDQDLYVKFGPTAAANDYTTLVPPRSPFSIPDGGWTGRVDAIWGATGGAAQVTEMT